MAVNRCPDQGLSRFVIQHVPSVQNILGGIDSERISAIVVYADSNFTVQQFHWGDNMYTDTALVLFPLYLSPVIPDCNTPNELNIGGTFYQIFRLVPTDETSGNITFGSYYENQQIKGSYKIIDQPEKNGYTEHFTFTDILYSYSIPDVEPQSNIYMNGDVFIQYTYNGKYVGINDYAYPSDPNQILCKTAHVHTIGLTGENATISEKIKTGYPFFIAKISAQLASLYDL